MLARSVRLLCFRGRCVTPTLPGSRSRCLTSAVGGSDRSQERPNSSSGKSSLVAAVTTGAVASGLFLAWYLHVKGRRGCKDGLPASLLKLEASNAVQEGDNKTPAKVSVRERRYKDYSSIRFKGEPYMTPRDFLESVTLDEPRRKYNG